METDLEKYNKYQPDLDFINEYAKAKNAATGSKFDANANIESKNVATLSGEMHKGKDIGRNRLKMIQKLTEMYGRDTAEEYIRQLDTHEIYRHDETHPELPYCAAITMYPFLDDGLKSLGGPSSAPQNLDSYCGNFVNLVFAVASQFAGACATPEALVHLDYYIRKEYGNDYYMHPDIVVDAYSKRPKTLEKLICDKFEQIVYTLNEPASARNYQSVFWNISYYDKIYFESIFGGFYYPDGDKPRWESVSWLQKLFMKWLNKERKRYFLTFPVETVNLVYDPETKEYKDPEWANFAAEMWAEGHSFFCYNSDSADALSSCCFSKDQKVLARSTSRGNAKVYFDTFESIGKTSDGPDRAQFEVFHNGSWCHARKIKLPKRQMYKITTSNKKTIVVSDNHLNVTLRGNLQTKSLTTNDYLMFNVRPLEAVKENDLHLTYEQGFTVGAFLGDGSFGSGEVGKISEINFSLNAQKYATCIDKINLAAQQLGSESTCTLSQVYNNVYPVRISCKELADFIIRWTAWDRGTYAYNKKLSPQIFLQSKEFRQGILDGWYETDGGNSNRCYTTSPQLVECMEALITSLGLCSVIDESDRTDEPVIIRNAEFARNYPLSCIRWYDPKGKRSMGDVYKVVNNSMYFKIDSIEKVDYDDDIYCFEMENKDEPYFTLPNGIITHNCRLKNAITDNVFSYTLGAGGISTGSKAVITININRLVQDAVKNGEDISEKVRKQVQKNHKYLLAYNEILKDELNAGLMPVYDAGYISMEKQYLTNGLNGLIEAAEFLGIEVGPNEEYYKFCESILKPMMEENKLARTKEVMFNTEYVPAENLGVKNAKWDKQDGYFVPRDCYNSYFFRVEDDSLSVIDKMVMHGHRVIKYLDGGSACHINLAEHLSQEQYRKLLDVAAHEGCSYFTFNIPNTICNECGHISKHYMDKCPKCGSENVDYITRIIGYAKRVSKWSAQRQEEAKKRFYGNGEDINA